MRKFATLCLVALALASATTAFALDNQKRSGVTPHPGQLPITNTAVLGCDNGTFFNAYFQAADDRIGNAFNFGSSSVLSRVSFLHFGFGFAGPYNYDLEIWDPVSCTRVAFKAGLVAGDAAGAERAELVELCADNITLSGNRIVAVWPKSCLAANDCYPDIAFDNQFDVACPYIINTASTTPVCNDVAPFSGPFLLRVETNACAVPTSTHSWGQVKSFYR